MGAPVTSLSTADKIQQVFSRVGKYAGDDVQQVLSSLITPTSLGIIAGTMAVWGVAQFFGVGEIVDIIMLAVGVAVLGKNAIDFAQDLAEACTRTLRARTDDDLEMAAQYLGKAIVEAGVEVVLALLLRKDLGEIKIKLDRVRQMKLGMDPVAPKPPAGTKPTIRFTRTLGSGTDRGWVRGETDAYGNIKIAREGYQVVQSSSGPTARWTTFSSAEKLETILHESVHRFLSPKLDVLREFRASAGITGYKRLYLLQYLEEAMAQGYAAIRTRGISGVWEGITFPIENGYVSLTDFATSGKYVGAVAGLVAMGQIYISGQTFLVHSSRECRLRLMRLLISGDRRACSEGPSAVRLRE
jgi:hypothetical protein